MAAVHAMFTIHLRADQIVIGTAINFLAIGITGYLFIDIYGDKARRRRVSMVPSVSLPGIEHWSRASAGVFGSLNLMIWLLFGLIIAVARRALPNADRAAHPRRRRAPAGGRHGRHPGVRLRYASVIVSGMLAALGGAYLSIGFVGSFDQNMTAGRGFIALAA